MTAQREPHAHTDRQRHESYVTATVAAGFVVVAGVVLGALFFVQPTVLATWGQGTTYSVGVTLVLILLLAASVVWWAVRELNAALAAARHRIAALAQVDQEGAQIVAELERRAAEQARLNRLVATLSAPLIPVSDQIVVVPLVGAIDRERLLHIHKSLLQRIEQQRARAALIDLTGVAEIEPQAIELFRQLIAAVELMGCRAILTGINTATARSFLDRGVDLPIAAHRDVKAGIAYAMELFVQTGERD